MNEIDFPAWPGHVAFDVAANDAVALQLKRRRAARPFVLASASLERSGALAGFAGDTARIHSAIRQHSPQTDVLAAAERARACDADAIVSVGGGSVIDAAKLVQVALSEGISTLEELAAWRTARRRSPRRDVPHIAVPTTLSGAEFTWFAGARNPQSGLKEAFAARWMMPAAILYDPALAGRTPLRLWLSTGIRSIDHAVETLLSDRLNCFAETLCVEGIRGMMPALDATMAVPDDRAARSRAQRAAWFCAAGLTSGVPMGASHAFGHVLGSLFDVPHGITSCVMLPAVMRFNGVHVPDRIARLSALFGPDPAAGLRRWIAALGLPTRLAEIGVGTDKIDAVVEGLADESWLDANPRSIEGRADIEAIVGLAA